MKKTIFLLFFTILIFSCAQEQKKSSSPTSTQTQVYTLNIQISPLGAGSVSLNPQSAGNKYVAGTVVTLTATANTGYQFSYWSGDVETTTSPVISVVIDSNKTIVANFSQKQSTSTTTPTYYSLTTNVNPEGSGTIIKTPDRSSYLSGSVVTLQAISATGYYFVGWSGDISGTQNPISITMDSDKSITANFEEVPSGSYSLDITLDPPDGGVVKKEPDKSYYSLGEELQLTVIPNEGFSFEGWSGNLTGNQNPVTITITSNMKITANFSRNQYTINITITPPNTGIVKKTPNYEWYYLNDQVTLEAVPLQGYKFVSWSGDIESTDNPITIIMDSDKNITATFEQLPQEEYTISIRAIPNTQEQILWITKDPDKLLYSYGERVTITANPPAGWRLIKWVVNGTEYTQNPIVIEVTGNMTVEAYFE